MSSPTSPRRVAQIREIAALLGHPERGEALIAEIDAAQRRLAQAPRRAAIHGASGRQRRLHGRPGEPRGGADGRSRAQAAARRARRVRRLRAARKADRAAAGFLVLSNVLELPDGQGALYLTHPALRALYPPARRILLPSRYTLCGGPSLIAAFDYLTDVVTQLSPTDDALSFTDAAPTIPRRSRPAHRARRSARPAPAAGSAAI